MHEFQHINGNGHEKESPFNFYCETEPTKKRIEIELVPSVTTDHADDLRVTFALGTVFDIVLDK